MLDIIQALMSNKYVNLICLLALIGASFYTGHAWCKMLHNNWELRVRVWNIQNFAKTLFSHTLMSYFIPIKAPRMCELDYGSRCRLVFVDEYMYLTYNGNLYRYTDHDNGVYLCKVCVANISKHIGMDGCKFKIMWNSYLRKYPVSKKYWFARLFDALYRYKNVEIYATDNVYKIIVKEHEYASTITKTYCIEYRDNDPERFLVLDKIYDSKNKTCQKTQFWDLLTGTKECDGCCLSSGVYACSIKMFYSTGQYRLDEVCVEHGQELEDMIYKNTRAIQTRQKMRKNRILADMEFNF